MIQLHCGDCFDILPTIDAGSIDLVYADVPYGTTECKWDSVLDLERMWSELYRVAKESAATRRVSEVTKRQDSRFAWLQATRRARHRDVPGDINPPLTAIIYIKVPS